MGHLTKLPLDDNWDEFVAGAWDGTLYHASEFIKFTSNKVEQILPLGFKKKGKILSLIPMGIVSEDGQKVLKTPYSASFTGFCFGPGFHLDPLFGSLRNLEEIGLELGIQRIHIGQPPLFYYGGAGELIEYGLSQKGYQRVTVELNHYVTAFDAPPAGVGRNLKKADRLGLKFRADIDLRAAALFQIHHKQKRGLNLSVGVDELELLSRCLPGKIQAHGVFYHGVMVASIIVYIQSKHIAMGFNWDQDYEFQSYRCTDFLLCHVMSHYFRHGFSIFDLGTSSLNGDINWGLTRFKEGFGSMSGIRTVYQKCIKHK